MGKSLGILCALSKIPSISGSRSECSPKTIETVSSWKARRSSILRVPAVCILTILLQTLTVKSFAETSPYFTREQQELEYWSKHQTQVLKGLEKLYEADDLEKTETQLPSFTSHTAGMDAGFGLHVVKRWKNVIINEHWPLVDGRVSLPDEIRVRVAPEVEGEMPIYARLRVLWKPIRSFIDGSAHPVDRPSGVSEPFLFVEPQFLANERLNRRAPISTLDCLQCHSRGNTITSAISDSQDSPSHPLMIGRKRNQGFDELIDWISRNVSHFPRLRADQEIATLNRILIKEGSLHLRTPNLKEVVADLIRGKRTSGQEIRIDKLPADSDRGELCFSTQEAAMDFKAPAWSSPSLYLAGDTRKVRTAKGRQQWCRTQYEDSLSVREQEWRREESAYNWWTGAIEDQKVACYSPRPERTSSGASYCH